MNSEKYCLQWNNHHSIFTNVLSDFLRDQIMCDVTIAIDEKIFKAHQLILSACSPYFKTLFGQNPGKHPIIFMKDISPSVIEALLEFMYKGEVNILQNLLPAILKTAKSWQIQGLSNTDSYSIAGETGLSDQVRDRGGRRDQSKNNSSHNSNRNDDHKRMCHGSPALKRRRTTSNNNHMNTLNVIDRQNNAEIYASRPTNTININSHIERKERSPIVKEDMLEFSPVQSFHAKFEISQPGGSLIMHGDETRSQPELVEAGNDVDISTSLIEEPEQLVYNPFSLTRSKSTKNVENRNSANVPPSNIQQHSITVNSPGNASPCKNNPRISNMSDTSVILVHQNIVLSIDDTIENDTTFVTASQGTEISSPLLCEATEAEITDDISNTSLEVQIGSSEIHTISQENLDLSENPDVENQEPPLDMNDIKRKRDQRKETGLNLGKEVGNISENSRKNLEMLLSDIDDIISDHPNRLNPNLLEEIVEISASPDESTNLSSCSESNSVKTAKKDAETRGRYMTVVLNRLSHEKDISNPACIVVNDNSRNLSDLTISDTDSPRNKENIHDSSSNEESDVELQQTKAVTKKCRKLSDSSMSANISNSENSDNPSKDTEEGVKELALSNEKQINLKRKSRMLSDSSTSDADISNKENRDNSSSSEETDDEHFHSSKKKQSKNLSDSVVVVDNSSSSEETDDEHFHSSKKKQSKNLSDSSSSHSVSKESDLDDSEVIIPPRQSVVRPKRRTLTSTSACSGGFGRAVEVARCQVRHSSRTSAKKATSKLRTMFLVSLDSSQEFT